MNINILLYSLFSVAGDQEVDHTFVKFKLIMFALPLFANK